MHPRSSRPTLLTAVLLAAIPAHRIDAQTAPDPNDPPAPRVVATVGERELTEVDLYRELNRLIPLSSYHANVSPEKIAELRTLALDGIIEQSLIEQDARARGLDASEAEIRQEFERAGAQLGERFAALAEAEKQDLLAQFRPVAVHRILVQENEARFEGTVPTLDEDALRARFEERKHELLAPPEARFQHIMVKTRPEAPAEFEQKRARIVAARQSLADGVPFDEVARAFSEDELAANGGDTGLISPRTLLKRQVDKVAFELEVGELSDIVQSIYGYHLVRCVEKKPPRTLSFEEAAEMLRAHMQDDVRTRTRARWLEELRSRYPVVVHEAFAPPPPDGPAPGADKSKG